MTDGRRTLILTHHKDEDCTSSLKATFTEFLYPAVIVFIIVALIVPACVYFLIYDLGKDPPEEPATCVIAYDYRVPCGYIEGERIGNITANACEGIDCCYDEHRHHCYHYLPSKYGFKQGNKAIYTRKQTNTPLGNPMHGNLSVQVTEEMNYLKVQLLPQKDRKPQLRGTFAGVSYKLYEDTLALDVFRTDQPEMKIVQTTRGPLIASDGYWEWTMQLTHDSANGTLYGLGGLVITANVSKVIYRNEADHTTLPFFLAQHGDDFHAVLVEHVGVLEIQVLQSKLIVLRAVNTEGLSLRLFPGPRLDDIYRQRDDGVNVVNADNIPRWLLGTHICRNEIVDVTTAVMAWDNEQALHSGLRPDGDCFNEMLMIMMIENLSSPEVIAELRRVVGRIKAQGKFILPITPHIPIGEEYELYKAALKMDVLFKNISHPYLIYEGQYKNRRVAFLDFSAIEIKTYINLLFSALQDNIVPYDQIDGIFLLDNWPQDDNYKFNATREKLLYFNEDIIIALNQTLPLTITNQDHSVQSQEAYVMKQMEIIKSILPHPIIISSTYFFKMQSPLLPQYVNLTWTDLKATTTKYLFNNIFTHPLSLSPVCGTHSINGTSTHNELCARWFINSATQPGQRFTTNWLAHENFTRSSRNIAEKALTTKRMLSYYQFGVLKSTGYASKPMFMDFYKDNETETLDEQYMLGDLLVKQVVLPRAEVARVYLPVKYHWFEFWGGTDYGNGWKDINIARDERILFVKEGSIVPLLQETALERKVKQSFSILIAKRCNEIKQAEEGNILFDYELLGIQEVSGGLQFSNVLKVKTEIGCDSLPRAHPFEVEKVQVYDCTLNRTIYRPQFDLCKQTKDVVTILYDV